MSQRSDIRAVNETASTTPLVIAVCAIAAGLVFALGWAATTRVPELVRASGQIGPLNDLDRVDHFDGGIVKQLYVNPGDHVSKGQLLAIIEEPNLRTGISTTEQQISILQRDLSRLHTVFDSLSLSNPPTLTETDTALSAYITSQDALFRARRATMTARIKRLDQAVRTAQDILEQTQLRLDLAETMLKRDEGLYKRRIISEADLLDRRSSTQQTREHVLEARASLLRARDQLQEAKAQLTEAETTWREELLAKIYDVDGELSALSVQQAELHLKAERSALRAPQDGVIQNIEADAIGQVVSPGGPVMEILASDQALVAIAKLAPKDIGHVYVGARVHIRPTTFDFRRYGDVTGTVTSVSPTSQKDEQNTPYFRAVITLDDTSIGKGKNRRGLHAGMEITADITNSDRTVLSYFLKPAERVMQVSLTER